MTRQGDVCAGMNYVLTGIALTKIECADVSLCAAECKPPSLQTMDASYCGQMHLVKYLWSRVEVLE